MQMTGSRRNVGIPISAPTQPVLIPFLPESSQRTLQFHERLRYSYGDTQQQNSKALMQSGQLPLPASPG